VTAYRFVTLTCDSCGAVFDSGIHATVGGVRASAYYAGWRQPVRGRDQCEDCIELGRKLPDDRS